MLNLFYGAVKQFWQTNLFDKYIKTVIDIRPAFLDHFFNKEIGSLFPIIFRQELYTNNILYTNNKLLFSKKKIVLCSLYQSFFIEIIFNRIRLHEV